MLNGIHLKNLKAFADTGEVPLKRINILLGANNAGKTTFLSAIELFFRSIWGASRTGPLAFDTMASFTSFDSTLRRHWSRSEPRPHSIHLAFDYTYDERGKKKPTRFKYDFECIGNSKDDTIAVRTAKYATSKEEFAVKFEENTDGSLVHSFKLGDKEYREKETWFHQLIPAGVLKETSAFSGTFDKIRYFSLEVVNPYRPVPRSFYVLDDPNLGREDRSLLTYLVRLWLSKDQDELEIKGRITKSLVSLGLAKTIDVAQVSKRIGPKVVEIRVAPSSARQNVTIADAGFGLSQVLPLVVYDSRLSDGYFIAYQPEVHLHPYAQSRLADLFVESANRGNQVFVETHSPDLILRLQAKIARKEIDGDAVNILCFENKGGKKTVVSPVSFSTTGKPTMNWPSGFLDTSLNLARDLTAARISGEASR
jgi:AAA15 family ATPase/GTPase